MSKFRNMKLRYKLAVGAAAGTAVVAAAGGAFAYFSASGNGTSGAGSVGSTTAWTVNSPSAVGGDLYPGQGTQSFAFVVSNASNGSQGLNAVKATVNPHNAGCDASWYSVNIDNGAATGNGTGTTETYASPVDVAKNSSQPVSVVIALTDSGTNQNACQGDAPTVTLAAS